MVIVFACLQQGKIVTNQTGTEAARLAELHSYDILDSPPEAAFEDVVSLLQQLLDVPVVLISLVDRDRQWFKARVGMEEPETPLSQSICYHAIQGEGLLEIEDTLSDPRSCGNPLCCGPNSDMRFYAGALLVSPSGHKLGTLCVLDRVSRKLTDLQRQTLQVMADQVMRQLDLRRALRVEAVLRDEIDHRVKNSLQTVASLVRLYRARAESDESCELLDAVARRVAAVAELHSELYKSGVRSEIDAESYLSRVVELLRRQAPEGVDVASDFAELQLDPDVASALAILVSEFAANSFKHAFPGDAEGELRICLADTGDGVELVCSDNGKGDTGSEPDGDGTGIGKRLMEAAAERVGGQLSLKGGPDGYRLRVLLSPEAAEAAA